jgi:RNA polymerase sigma-70 factor (ECF subfamily)
VQQSNVVVEELFVRARAGDAAAFGDLVSEHGADVLRLCTVITADRGLAEDAAQNAWHRVWRSLATVREPSALRAWLLRVAANEAKQIVRQNRRHEHRDLGEVPAIQPPPPDEDVALRDALRLLDPAERELLGAPLRARADIRRDR